MVAVVDTKTNLVFQLETTGRSAMDVFAHPFAYAPDSDLSILAA